MDDNTQIHDVPIACFKEISNWINSVLDLDQLLELIIDTATQMMEAKASSLLLLDEKTNKLYFKVATGVKKEELEQFELNVGEGIAGYVAQTGDPLLISDVSKEPRWDKRISQTISFDTKSIACVPMLSDGKILGVVEIIDKEDGTPIKQSDMKTLTGFADLAAMAIRYARQIDQFKKENRDLKKERDDKYRIIGESRCLMKVLSDAYKVANSRTSTLILGESGTGKELLARLIHQAGPRNSSPLIVINCAALPENLLETELFGHEKGAFTGASSKKIGKFEMADTGTIFLDEIGEMSPSMQVKLLRVLQEGVFYRVGGTSPISVDVRIISATNRDISREVQDGRFREDLYYRLNVVQLKMPPLRERKEDIPLLAHHFIQIFKQETGMELTLSEITIKGMLQYDWPGNIRELRNVIERAVVMRNDKSMVPEAPPLSSDKKIETDGYLGLTLKDALDKFKKEFIRENLDYALGNKSNAAKTMDIQRTYLSRLVSKYKIRT
jgi:Nif-specific regulatory protein